MSTTGLVGVNEDGALVDRQRRAAVRRAAGRDCPAQPGARRAERIRAACDDILAHAVELLGEVDEVPELLATTDAVVTQIAVGATRYAGSVATLLAPKEE